VPDVDKCMALAGVLATKRVLRYRTGLSANGRSAGVTEMEQAERAVAKATADLRAALEKLACTKSPSALSSLSTS
jgi:hypothetical protein